MNASDVGFGIAVGTCAIMATVTLAYRFVPALRQRLRRPEQQHSCQSCQGSGIQFRFKPDGTPEMVFCSDLKERR